MLNGIAKYQKNITAWRAGAARVYIPPSMPSMTAASEGIKKAATEAKLIDPIEISDLRQSDHGPGRFILCMRGVDSKYRRVRI